MDNKFKTGVFNINNEQEFINLTLEIFHYQARENEVYKKYLKLLGIKPSDIKQPHQVPFLPVEFFKNHKVITGNAEPVMLFESSGTTGTSGSKHYIIDPDIYSESLTRCFGMFYGSPENFTILALLPSYLERKNSSLVYMAHRLIELSKQDRSGFYLDNFSKLAGTLENLEANAKPALLIGVSFALLELAEKFPMPLQHTTIMETGGMKGRREEITREKLHEILKNSFRVGRIHSEYGMTELLSQAYAKESGIFYAPPWMSIMIRDTYDPFSLVHEGKSGGINIIDLANIHSCSFISTQDIGRLHPGGGFEVLGRFDNSDIRGCNLMME